MYALVHFFRFYKSGHGIIRMFFFHIQALVRLFTARLESASLISVPVQYLLPRLLLVRPGESVAHIQYHY